MPNCLYKIQFTRRKEEICNFDIDKPGEELCYVHRCITRNEKIDDQEKFFRFLGKHRETFSYDTEHPRMLIDFNFKYRYAKENIFNNIIFFKDFNFDNADISDLFEITNCDFEKNVSFKKFK